MSGAVQALIGSLKAAGGDPNWSSVTLLLPGNGTNGAQNNTFIDSSANAFSITRNGNPTQGTFSPFSITPPYSTSTRGGSGYFDGTGDYLSGIGTTSSFNFMHNSTALFTFECWLYTTSTANQALVDNCGGTTSNIGVSIAVDAGQFILLIARGVTGVGNAVIVVTDGGAVPINQWVHLALTYDQSQASSNAKFYVNGVNTKTANKTVNIPSASNATNAMVAAVYNGGSFPVIGYLSNLRITNSIVYTAAFTPPTSPLTAITNTQLLLNFTNGGIIDNAMLNDLETVGNAQISTAQSKFGGSSIYFDGSGDRLVGANTPNVNIDAGNFTIEGWIYCATPTITSAIVAKGFGAAGGYMLWVQSTLRMRVYDAGGTQFNAVSTGTISANTWTHVAAVRNGGTITLYINGVADGSVAYTGTSTNSAVIEVGSYNAGSGDFSGYIDDLRITKGVARYTANFTPPAAAFPTS